jgi:hypothetical protein
MNKISKNLIIFSVISAVVGYWFSHFQVNFLSIEDRTFQNLFITKINSIEGYLLAILLILLAIYFKKND